MKSRLTTVVIACCVVLGIYAQSNEIFVGYGVAPQGIGNKPSSWSLIAFPHLNPTKDYPYVHPTYTDKQSGVNNGAFTVGYMHKVVAGLSLGASYSYFTTTRDLKYDEADIKMNIASCSKKNHVIMAFAKYQWLHIGRLSLYSRAGVGVKLCSSYTVNPNAAVYEGSGLSTIPQLKDGLKNYTYAAYQVMPLGVDLRVAPFVYLFAEGGYGSIGCFQCGVKTKF